MSTLTLLLNPSWLASLFVWFPTRVRGTEIFQVSTDIHAHTHDSERERPRQKERDRKKEGGRENARERQRYSASMREGQRERERERESTLFKRETEHLCLRQPIHGIGRDPFSRE